jgi:hypothetical protein
MHSFIPRGFVRSWKDLAQHLRWNIQEGNVKNLNDWFYHHRTPMYFPRDLQKMEKIIFGFPTHSTYQALPPTLLRPYYRYVLNPQEITEGHQQPVWYLIYWPPKASSQVHSHPDGGCIWWLIDGKVKEIVRSQSPTSSIFVHNRPFGIESISEPILASHTHQILNGKRESISLHCYWNGIQETTISNNHHHTK